MLNVRHALNVSSAFQQIIFIQVILEEERIVSKELLALIAGFYLNLSVSKIVNYIVGELFLVGSIWAASLSLLVTGIKPRSLQAN